MNTTVRLWDRGTVGRLAGSLMATAVLLFPVPGSPLFAQSPTSLTIYNDGRVLVRRTLPVELAKGNCSQRLTLGALDPVTFFSADSQVVVTAMSYDGAVDQGSVLRRAVGHRLVFRYGGPKDTISALVLGVDPERYKMPDGTVSFSMPGAPLFPEELVVVDPTASISLRCLEARHEFRLGYFTAGAQWQASYQVILGSTSAQVAGAAVIQATTLKADNAEIQLLAGSVSRAPSRNEGFRANGMVMAKRADEEADYVSQQKVGEFHLYSLPGRTTLQPGITSTVSLFDPARVKYERHYVVRGQIPYWGGLPQYGEETEVPVEISYTLLRPRKTDFGDRPLAGGVVRLYQADAEGRLQLVGESSLDHTPAGEDLRLAAGQAFDLTAKRVQTSYSTRRDSLPAGGWRTIATADYTVTLSNASDSATTVDVQEQRSGEWSVVSSSVPAQKVSSTITRFRVAVPAKGKSVLRYRVRVIW